MSGLVRFQEHLRELFQLDKADLDLGIYRLFAARPKEVDQFIEKELPETVDAAFSALLNAEGKGMRKGFVIYLEEYSTASRMRALAAHHHSAAASACHYLHMANFVMELPPRVFFFHIGPGILNFLRL